MPKNLLAHLTIIVYYLINWLKPKRVVANFYFEVKSFTLWQVLMSFSKNYKERNIPKFKNKCIHGNEVY